MGRSLAGGNGERPSTRASTSTGCPSVCQGEWAAPEETSEGTGAGTSRGAARLGGSGSECEGLCAEGRNTLPLSH